jgi:hypothetical protein
MDPLHVVTAIANPIRWQSRARLYRQFEEHMLDSGIRLTVVECAYGDHPHEFGNNPHVTHVPVRARSVLWTKENLLNIGLGRLPQDWRHVAWVDADITFRRSDWATETVHALQQYDVVQPWSDCYDLGPNDEHLHVHRAFCRLAHDGAAIGSDAYNYTFAHPGYAWAATRRALSLLGGLIETAALGAADHHMALALFGRVHESVPAGIGDGYMRPLLRWQDRARHHIAGNISYVPGSIEHDWHGAKPKRAYGDRWAILTRNGFDPDTDLIRNTWGVLELAGNKPQLRLDIDRYFRARDEDSNSLG